MRSSRARGPRRRRDGAVASDGRGDLVRARRRSPGGRWARSILPNARRGNCAGPARRTALRARLGARRRPVATARGKTARSGVEHARRRRLKAGCGPGRAGRRRAGRRPRPGSPDRPAASSCPSTSSAPSADRRTVKHAGARWCGRRGCARRRRARREAGDELEVVDDERRDVVGQTGAVVEHDLDVPGVERVLVDPQAASRSKSRESGPSGTGEPGSIGVAHRFERLEHALVGRPGRRRPGPGASWRSTRPTPTERSRRASWLRTGRPPGGARMMTAPDPRCESTSAIDHSLQ